MRKSFFFICRTLVLAVVLGAFAPSAAAAPLTEYRENVTHLRDDLDSIINPAEDATAEENLEFEKEALAEFSEMLPARDKIEWQNSTTEINNQWIYDALQRFEKEPPASTKRRLILIEISERLAALEDKLNELENRTTSATKDENKQKLADILRRPEYQKPEEKQKNRLEEWYLKIVEWIAGIFPRPNISPSIGSGFQSLSFFLQMLLYAAILGVIGFIVYRFAPLFVKKYRSKNKSERAERVILGERLAANETAQNLFDEAENLARAGNLRGAIRKGYIALLCELSDKKIIGLSQHKTNRDYLRDVRQKDVLYKNMSGLTANYERHWYGFETAEEKDWEDFRSGYRKAVGSSSRQ